MKAKNKNFRNLLATIALLVLVNFIGSKIFRRYDLTEDKRYTLSQTSLAIVNDVKQPLYVDVFLKGDFPGEFKRLQTETSQLLEEFGAYNNNIIFRFTNPFDDSEGNEEKKDLIFTLFKLNNPIITPKEEKEIKESIERIPELEKALEDSFYRSGLTPISVTVDDKGKQSEEVVFPWAVATYGNRTIKIPLLKNMMGASTQEKVVSSVQHLEYAFANAFNTVIRNKQKRIAIIKGNGELQDQFIGNFLKQVRENYYIAPFPLDSITLHPNEALRFLKKNYDLAIIAKPTKRFSDEEKEVLDQFVVNGGKTIWLVDQVNMEMDSLYNDNGIALAFPNDLNLNDQFFKYGIRINPDLVKDIMATPIVLATGEQGSATQYTQFPWFYSPMVYPTAKNPIVSNLDGIKFEFASGIELLKNDIRKTVLLQSSQYSKTIGTPVEVNLKMVEERPEQSEFTGKGNIPLAVLLEGKFHSVYQNRILPFPEKTFAPIGKESKMIVISDGDVIKNQLDKNNMPVELGYDQRTKKMYANKEFMMNCVNYLLDDNGLINIRSKEVSLPLLDKEKVYDNYTSSQMITVGLPIVVLAIFGLLFTFLRKRKYTR
jgi:gliding-associated putative ABC transporter substrate-binding component GldG